MEITEVLMVIHQQLCVIQKQDLSAIAAELLRDIEKETVDLFLTLMTQAMEPTVLPAMFPNLT